MLKRKLRMGMIGGGRGAFIGKVHRTAARLDGQIELTAGCFSADSEKSRLSGRDLFLDPARIYRSYEEMAEKETVLPEDTRIDFVSIVTPNHLHYPIAACFLKAGFHVVCEKPMADSLAEARQLRQLVEKTSRIFALTHNYSGYPMVKEARSWAQTGKLGDILKIVVEYPQGGLVRRMVQGPLKPSGWRQDPEKAGLSCCIADIGSHAEHLARYITGMEIEAVCAEFTSSVPGSPLENDGNILLRYRGGVKGLLFASQICGGEENALNIRVYGTNASLEWRQEYPGDLTAKYPGQPRQILRRGNPYLCEAAKKHTRLPAGHPEAFIEAFANIYAETAEAIRAAASGKKKKQYDFPGARDGLLGMAFIEACVKSAASNRKWTPVPAV